jgi:hypothetical protein
MSEPSSKDAKGAERPEQLVLLERWARMLGMATQPTSGSGPGDRTIQGLEIQRGELSLVAFALPPEPAPDGQFIVLRALIEIPSSVRATIAGQSVEARRRLTEAVYGTLMAQGRTAFQVHPSGASDAATMEQVGLEQVLRLDAADASSFNRFADGVQELATALSRLGRHYLDYVSAPGGG